MSKKIFFINKCHQIICQSILEYETISDTHRDFDASEKSSKLLGNKSFTYN